MKKLVSEMNAVKDYLRRVVERNESTRKEESIAVREMLSAQKVIAVRADDQSWAKLVWCHEQVLSIQNNYLTAFRHMKAASFYSAWCLLEQVEIELRCLRPHFDIDANGDEYKLSFINSYVLRFQALFPYKWFLSPGAIYLEKICTICGRSITLRSHCGHKVGQIYDGTLCTRTVTKATLLEVSLVSNPVQKYSVVFSVDPTTGQTADCYDYTLVNYVVTGLASPFDRWSIRWTYARHPHSRYVHVEPNSDCPCGSGREYCKCCLEKEGVLRPHGVVLFEKSPPEHLPRIAYTRSVE